MYDIAHCHPRQIQTVCNCCRRRASHANFSFYLFWVHLGAKLVVQKETFQAEPYSRFILNHMQEGSMKKLIADEKGIGASPSVDQVIERIASALGARTQGEWMEQLEVQPETVRTWRKRGAVPISQIAKVAGISGRPIEWFNRPYYLSEESGGNFFPGQEKQVTLKGSATAGEESVGYGDLHEYLYVPQLSVSTSAGGGNHIDQEIEVGKFAFRRSWVQRKGLIAGKLRVITARGRSMEPTVRDGDILLVDTSEQIRLTEGIYVIDYGGESRCKRLMPLFDGGLKICSDNPDYPPEEVKAGQIDQVRVVGRVIWVGGER